MSAIEALTDLLNDLRRRESALEELRDDGRRTPQSVDRITHKLEGLRLGIGLAGHQLRVAIRDECETN